MAISCVGDSHFNSYWLLLLLVATHRDDVLVVGGEGDAVDAVLVPWELGHTGLSVL